jgi:uncharacterized Zn finger protein
VLYGVGSRLDSSPELLFVLRGVDHLELIEQAIPTAPLGTGGTAPTIATGDLGDIFGIEIGDAPPVTAATAAPPRPAAKPGGKKTRTVKSVPATKAVAQTPAKPATKQAATSARAARNVPATKPTKAKAVPKKKKGS